MLPTYLLVKQLINVHHIDHNVNYYRTPLTVKSTRSITYPCVDNGDDTLHMIKPYVYLPPFISPHDK